MVATINVTANCGSLLGKQVLYKGRVCMVGAINADSTVVLEQMVIHGQVFNRVNPVGLFFL